jgi:hypothetical protein
MMSGRDRLIASTNNSDNLVVSDLVPKYLSGRSLYSGCLLKN